MLRRVWISDQIRSVLCEFRTKIRAVESCKPEGSGGNRRIGTTDHLELEVRHDAGERDGRVCEKGMVTESANLLRTKDREDNRAFRSRPGGEDVRQRQDRCSAGGIVVGAVVVGVVGCARYAHPKVVEMRRKQNDLVWRTCSAQDANRIPRLLARHVLKFC